MTKQEFLNVLSSFANKYSVKIDSLFVRKVDGKGLSTNDFTNELKAKLDGVAEGANKTIVDAALNADSTNPVENKAIVAALAGKSDEGHVHAFADLTDKPTTLAGYGITDKLETEGAAAQALIDAKAYTDQEVAALVDGAPETMNTLKEVSEALKANDTVVEALNAAIGSKADATEFANHVADEVAHITAEERTAWNGAVEKEHVHANADVLAATTASFTTEEKEKLAALDIMEDVTDDDIDNIVAGCFA